MKANYHLVPNCIYDEDLSPYAITVYGYLTRCADKTNTCYPTRENIAKKCGIKSVRTVDKCLAILEDLGYIEKTYRYKVNGTNMSNIYTICKM